MRRRRLASAGALTAALAVSLVPVVVRAEGAGPTTSPRNGFEQRLLQRVARARGLAPHPDPAGKRIARIDVVSEPVFTPEDPVPDQLNILHITTRERVVRRELLFAVGDTYDPEAIAESARNLRALAILTVARIVPFRIASEPDSVGVLVVTKDLWSLRHGFTALTVTGDYYAVSGALTEMNLLGLNKAVAILYGVSSFSKSVGQQYIDQRLLDSAWTAFEQVVVLDDDDGGVSVRGSYGLVRPFRSLATRWGGHLLVGHGDGTQRIRSGAGVHQVSLPGGDVVPAQYAFANRSAEAVAGYQVSDGLRHRVLGGLSWFDNRLSMPFADLDGQEEQEFFRALRRRSEAATRLMLSYSLASTDYRRLRGVAVYSVTEDFTAGPFLDADAALGLAVLGGDSDHLRLDASAGYRWIPADGRALVTTTLGTGARLEDGAWIDRNVHASVFTATPRSAAGRLIWSVWMQRRTASTTFGLVATGDGSDSATLRSHPVGELVGDSLVVSNLEYRSRSGHWQTQHLGWVAFVDWARGWTEGEPVATRMGGGLGVRWFAPQLNKRAFSFDCAVPFELPVGYRCVFNIGQAF